MDMDGRGQSLKEVEGLANSWSSFTVLVVLRVKLPSLSNKWCYKKNLRNSTFLCHSLVRGTFAVPLDYDLHGENCPTHQELSFMSTPMLSVDGAVSLLVHSRSLLRGDSP